VGVRFYGLDPERRLYLHLAIRGIAQPGGHIAAILLQAALPYLIREGCWFPDSNSSK